MKTLVEISLTNACVNACPYCIMKDYTKRVAYDKFRNAEGGGLYLSLPDILKFIHQMQHEHPEGLVMALTGGEPMCHPAFECFLDSLNFYKKDNNSKIVLYTNLKLLNKNRIKYINECVDYVIAGYHPSQLAYCFMREKGVQSTVDDFGCHEYTNKEWLKEQLDKLTCPKTINYIAGAYDDMADFEIWATKNQVAYVKTPCSGKYTLFGKHGAHLQLNPAPDMVSIRPDGTIIKCNGKPDVVGNIYKDDYNRSEMVCNSNCSLCPSFWAYFASEHLFNEET